MSDHTYHESYVVGDMPVADPETGKLIDYFDVTFCRECNVEISRIPTEDSEHRSRNGF